MATWCRRRWGVILAGALVIGAVAATAAFGRLTGSSVVPYAVGPHTTYGLRPTAVGLPEVGESGTVGVNALSNSLRAYHDSGAYESDLTAVDGAAQRYVDQRLADAGTARRVCAFAFQPRHIPGHGTLYARIRQCRVEKTPLKGKPAIVLDIDETSLSNYADLSAKHFDTSALVTSAIAGHGAAIQPTLRLYRDAVAHHLAVFFVTGRPAAIEAITRANLTRVGFNRGWAALYEKPATMGTEKFKAAARATITRRGYDILANVGDQQSDLDGGYADRAFKLPDPFYFISD